jgi:hypothetical protein
MWKYLKQIPYYYNNYCFEFILISIFVLLFFIYFYRLYKGQHGSYSKSYYYPTNDPYQYQGTPPNKYPFPLGSSKDSSGETECRRILQKIFRKPFNKARPNFLNNPVTGGNFNLELDCFNLELKLGVEFNGQQHYKYVPYFHKNKEAFQNQKYRDYMKRQKCKENGIKLIEVPYIVKTPDIEDYIIKELRKLGYKLP